MRGLIGAALVLAGCGSAGSFQGRAVWSVSAGGPVQNTEQVEVHQLLGGSETDYVIASDNCDLPANASGKDLLVASTTCITWRDGEEYDMTFGGEGSVDTQRLALSLHGPITIHRTNGSVEQGTFSYDFSGDRL
jgi:hypothetical protein